MADEFDYVIVGSGAAGSVLAGRLAEDPSVTVCVLEAGPPDRHPILTTQGRTIGGSSSINGMVYNRGQAADFDTWAQRGNRGWGFNDILPYFKRTERRIGGAESAYHGRAGGVPVTDMDWIHPVNEAFIEGCASIGMPKHNDYNGGHQAGAGYFQR